jgi:hypothetical protein
MMTTHATAIELAHDVNVDAWAHGWMKKDPQYITWASRFGSPLVRKIANFILEITGKQ